jgi:hypothetical protein
VGDAVSDIRDTQDRGHLAGIKLKMMEAEKAHELYRGDNPDESTWEEDMTRRHAEVMEYAAGHTMLPKNREYAAHMLDGWRVESGLNLAIDAKRNAIGTANGKILMAFDALEAEGRFDEMRDLLPLLKVSGEDQARFEARIAKGERVWKKQEVFKGLDQLKGEAAVVAGQSVLNDPRFTPAEQSRAHQALLAQGQRDGVKALEEVVEGVSARRIQTRDALEDELAPFAWVDQIPGMDKVRGRMLEEMDSKHLLLDVDEEGAASKALDDVVRSYSPTTEEAYRGKRADWLAKYGHLLVNENADDLRNRYGRSSLGAARQRDENIRSGKKDYPGWVEDHFDDYHAQFKDKHADKFVGEQNMAETHFKRVMPALIQSAGQDADFDTLYQEWLGYYADKKYTGASNMPASDSDWKWPNVSRHYTRDEMKSRGNGQARIDQRSIEKLDAAIDIYGMKVPVTSAYRDQAYNDSPKVKGAKNSLHVQGKAFDLDLTGMDDVQRRAVLQSMLAAGFTGIGFYRGSPNMLHVDTGTKRSWHWDKSRNDTGGFPDWAAGIMEAHQYE